MTRFVWATLAAALLIAADARAQPPLGPRPLTGVNTPPVSPYLNLLRPGTSPAINYYGLVRPEVNFMNSVQALQAQLGYAQQAAGVTQFGEPGTTGHPAFFLNHTGYFLNSGGSAAVTGGPMAPTRQPLGGGLPGSTAGMYRPLGR
jgi:hypothetical protein